MIYWQGSENPKAGWVSYAYSKKEPTPQLVYSINSKMPYNNYTLFYPAGSVEYTMKTAPDSVEIDLSGNNERHRIVFRKNEMKIGRLSF